MKKYLLFLLMVAQAAAASSIPGQITYQGTLKEKGIPANGPRNMVFRITNSDGKTVYWSSDNVSVPVKQGLFSIPLTPVLPNGVSWDTITPYIEVSVEGQLLLPREAITATLYSTTSGSVVDGAIGFAKLDPAVQQNLVPPGMMAPFGGSSPPAGWLVCDGSAVSRTKYPALFSAIGTVWGPGDSVSTFNLPDLRGRAAIGSGQGTGLTNRAIGQSLGEETHVLTVGEMPSHSHNVNDPGHAHESPTAAGGPFGAGPSQDPILGATGVFHGLPGSMTSSNVTGISIGTSGGGSAHNNIQPSAVVSYVIKY